MIRSSDGEVTQTVRDKDTAWHARSANASSVGIEHEGWVDEPAWFTDAMYRSSAALTSHLSAKFGIPKDRAHIVGHVEVPGNDHTDPGPHWDWNYYMELIGGDPGNGGDGLTFPLYTTQQSGSSGPQVTAVQTLLTQQKYSPGKVDGLFGATTKSAVEKFQRDRSLDADGMVGPKTWTALLSAGSTPLLKQGGSGDAVKRLQRALTAALGKTVGVDGSFGPATDSAVCSYSDHPQAGRRRPGGPGHVDGPAERKVSTGPGGTLPSTEGLPGPVRGQDAARGAPGLSADGPAR